MKYVRRQNRFRRGRRLKKRSWYFNAGANLPFIGKTNIAFGTNKQKRSIINVVRRGLEDPLHKLWSAAGTNILHNTLYTLNLTGNIPQGDTASSRSGDNIHLDALKLRMLFTTDVATNKSVPKEYRIMVVRHDIEGQAASDAFASSTLGTSDLFQGNQTPCFEHVNPKNCTVLYDKTCKLKPSISATNDLCEVSDIIRFNSTFTYKTNSNYGKMANYYLVLTSFEPGAATSATTAAAYFYGDLIYKDSK